VAADAAWLVAADAAGLVELKNNRPYLRILKVFERFHKTAII